MPVQKGKSSLLSKLGSKLTKAHEAHKSDDLVLGNMGLPEGIEGGVAQLVDCHIGQYKDGSFKGQPFFYAAGVVVEPKVHNGFKIEGLRTQIGPEPLCDTPTRTRKTFDENWGYMLNQIRALGVDTTEISGDTPDEVEANLLATLTALKEAQPHFRFRTWKGAKATEGKYKDREPRVNHVWGGICDFSENGQTESQVQDNTPAATEGTDESDSGEEAPDIDTLLESANADDGDAQEKLIELAVAAGTSEEDAKAADDWETVASMAKGEYTAPEPEPEPEEFTPAKGEVYAYRPIDPKTKKPVKKAIDVDVLSVDKKTKTVVLKQLSNPKIQYKNVKWDALEASS